MTFKKGSSGNPRGRPKGIDDRRSALRGLLEPHAPKFVQVLLEKALAGDMTAMRICFDRLMPPLRPSAAPINLEGLKGSLTERGRAVIDAVADGRVNPDEGFALMQALETQLRMIHDEQLKPRMDTLEDREDERKVIEKASHVKS